jgi:glutathione S-transferase
MTTLVTITFSHYCEKARWALDRCGVTYDESGHLPLFSYLASYRHGSRTVPVLIDGATVLRDSSEIVAWADARTPGALLPDDPIERAEALALEDDFDRNLGPATRRWGYAQLIREPRVVPHIVDRVPRWQALALRLARPVAMRAIASGLGINAAGIERSRVKIEQTFARIAERLRDGRRYLMGDRFTVADLTFAALAAPVLLPEQPAVPMPPREMFKSANTQIDAWRATPAGELVLRLYREDR